MGKRKLTRREKEQQSSAGNPPPEEAEQEWSFGEEMRRLRDERRQIKDKDKRQAMAARHAKIKGEYLKWQDDLCWLIRNKSKVSVQPDGSAVYVLPTDLVRLVWQTMITQRVAAETANGKSHHEALAIAMDDLQEKIGKLATVARAREGKQDEGERAGSTPPDGGSAAEPGDEQQDQPAS